MGQKLFPQIRIFPAQLSVVKSLYAVKLVLDNMIKAVDFNKSSMCLKRKKTFKKKKKQSIKKATCAFTA